MYNDAKNMPKMTKKAKERYPLGERVWEYYFEVLEFKEIAERLKLNQQSERTNRIMITNSCWDIFSLIR